MAVPWSRSTESVGTPCQARQLETDSPTGLPPANSSLVSIISPRPGFGPSRHDSEKWKPVFGKDHAPTQHLARDPIGRIIGWSSTLADRRAIGKPAFPFADHALNTAATVNPSSVLRRGG